MTFNFSSASLFTFIFKIITDFSTLLFTVLQCVMWRCWCVCLSLTARWFDGFQFSGRCFTQATRPAQTCTSCHKLELSSADFVCRFPLLSLLSPLLRQANLDLPSLPFTYHCSDIYLSTGDTNLASVSCTTNSHRPGVVERQWFRNVTSLPHLSYYSKASKVCRHLHRLTLLKPTLVLLSSLTLDFAVPSQMITPKNAFLLFLVLSFSSNPKPCFARFGQLDFT